MAGPYDFFDPRNPLFGGAGVKPMGGAGGDIYNRASPVAGPGAPPPVGDLGVYAPQSAPAGGIPGYPKQQPGPPGIYNTPAMQAERGQRAAQAAQGASFGTGMGNPMAGKVDFSQPAPLSPSMGPVGGMNDPAAEMFMQMRGSEPGAGRGTGALSTSGAPRGRAVPRGQPSAHTPAAAADPYAGYYPPEGRGAPAVPAAKMAPGDPDKQDFLDMQRAITEWQMGMGGTGQEMEEANKLQQTGTDIGAAANIKGNSVVNNLTRALGGVGEGYLGSKARGDRAKVKETIDQLRKDAKRQLDEVRERRRGGSKTTNTGASAQDRAFADMGDVSAIDDDPYRGYYQG